MKIVSVMFGILLILTLGYFVQIWKQIPSVSQSIQAQSVQSQSVQIGLSSAATPVASPSPTPSPIKKRSR